MRNLPIRPARVGAVALREIAERFGLACAGGDGSVQGCAGPAVTGVSMDSRNVREGDLYIAAPGARAHGADFAQQALASGAVAILTDSAGAKLLHANGAAASAPLLTSEQDPRTLAGRISAFVYNTENTSLKRFAVTGTNGKTSVLYMLKALCEAVGHKVGYSTTAERKIGETVIESSLTTPEAPEVHALLATMGEQEVSDALIEVSAQALVRHRVDGVKFHIAGFTNFSHDHLDDFSSMEEYFAAKQRLFTPEFSEKAVVLVDTAEGVQIAEEAQIPVTRVATQFGYEADWHFAITSHTLDGIHFVLQGPEDAYFRGNLPVFGRCMGENIAVALVMFHEAGYSLSELESCLDHGRIPLYIPGRLEKIRPKINAPSLPRCFVDYGHTPAAFESILDSLGEVCEGKIVFIFGLDGDRDTTKRATMGAISAQGAHDVIVCDYNPRSEDPAEIRRQVLEGARLSGGRARLHEIADPAEAVAHALKIANAGDVVLYAGPGHENTREVAGEHIPFSARNCVREALEKARKQ